MRQVFVLISLFNVLTALPTCIACDSLSTVLPRSSSGLFLEKRSPVPEPGRRKPPKPANPYASDSDSDFKVPRRKRTRKVVMETKVTDKTKVPKATDLSMSSPVSGPSVPLQRTASGGAQGPGPGPLVPLQRTASGGAQGPGPGPGPGSLVPLQRTASGGAHVPIAGVISPPTGDRRSNPTTAIAGPSSAHQDPSMITDARGLRWSPGTVPAGTILMDGTRQKPSAANISPKPSAHFKGFTPPLGNLPATFPAEGPSAVKSKEITDPKWVSAYICNGKGGKTVATCTDGSSITTERHDTPQAIQWRWGNNDRVSPHPLKVKITQTGPGDFGLLSSQTTIKDQPTNVLGSEPTYRDYIWKEVEAIPAKHSKRKDWKF